MLELVAAVSKGIQKASGMHARALACCLVAGQEGRKPNPRESDVMKNELCKDKNINRMLDPTASSLAVDANQSKKICKPNITAI